MFGFIRRKIQLQRAKNILNNPKHMMNICIFMNRWLFQVILTFQLSFLICFVFLLSLDFLYSSLDYLSIIKLDSNEMRRQMSIQKMGQVYREFSRQKYNKYKHQFPRMRESELVNKIIKEWEALDTPKKQDLNERYHHLKFIKDEEDEGSKGSSKKGYSPKKDLNLTCTPATLQKSGPVARHYPKVSEFEQNSDYNRNSQKMSQDHHSERSSSYSLLVVKDSPKVDGKKANSQYIQFYKFQYAHLFKQHPKWDAFKISKIVRLLWLKRQRYYKSVNQVGKREYKKRFFKKVAGKRHFRNSIDRQMSNNELNHLWKRLPFESKRRHIQMGKNEGFYLKPLVKKTIILGSKPMQINSPTGQFSFLDKM